MEVAVAHYDVRNGGQGVELFATEAIAIEAVIGWVVEANLIGQSSFQMTEQEAREALERGDGLVFETMECYYSVEMLEVQTKAPGQSESGETAGAEALATG